ncbi:hypothetical protein [Pseudomonas nitroreducens]|uniref:hypothetical protein n=1 Tax=Pseudomonas nitroreducens TaxID=46680 RepID=UPI003824B73C
MLLANGLKALQTAAIATTLPFSITLLASIWGLLLALPLDVTSRLAQRSIARTAPCTPSRGRLGMDGMASSRPLMSQDLRRMVRKHPAGSGHRYNRALSISRQRHARSGDALSAVRPVLAVAAGKAMACTHT